MHLETDALKTVIESILESEANRRSASCKSMQENEAVQAAATAIADLDPDRYFYALAYPIETMLDGLVKSHLPDSWQARFVFREYSFLNAHLAALFSSHEGSACSADKSRTVIQMALRFFVSGRRIEFDHTQEYTYHLPQRILLTHEAVIDMIEALARLHAGQPDAYLRALATLMAGSTDS